MSNATLLRLLEQLLDKYGEARVYAHLHYIGTTRGYSESGLLWNAALTADGRNKGVPWPPVHRKPIKRRRSLK